jgi:hypothetical protein
VYAYEKKKTRVHIRDGDMTLGTSGSIPANVS